MADPALYAKQPFESGLEVTPGKISIDCVWDEEVFEPLTLKNQTNSRIAWKVKTNRPKRYMVRPTQGIIEPRSETTCELILARMEEFPDVSNLRDKFRVQSVGVQQDFDINELSQMWREKELLHSTKREQYTYHMQQIKCNLVIPPSPPPDKINQDDRSKLDTLFAITPFSPKPEILDPSQEQEVQKDDQFGFGSAEIFVDETTSSRPAWLLSQQELASDTAQYEKLVQYVVKVLKKNEEFKKVIEIQQEKINSLKKQMQAQKSPISFDSSEHTKTSQEIKSDEPAPTFSSGANTGDSAYRTTKNSKQPSVISGLYISGSFIFLAAACILFGIFGYYVGTSGWFGEST